MSSRIEASVKAEALSQTITSSLIDELVLRAKKADKLELGYTEYYMETLMNDIELVRSKLFNMAQAEADLKEWQRIEAEAEAAPAPSKSDAPNTFYKPTLRGSNGRS